MNLFELWLPILATGLATHILSTIAWTVMPHHKPEWKPLSWSGAQSDLLNAEGAEPGQQFLLTEAEGSSDATEKDLAKCRGMLILWSHKPSMAKNIAMTLAYFFFVAMTIGYLASIAFTSEASALDVFRFTTTIALLTHVIGGTPTIIWFRRKFLMDWIDGLVYALATGVAFALLWPN